MPVVSVICPVYNAEKYLARAVKSVLAQSFEDFELILVDDGSTDGSGELCAAFAAEDKRVRVIHQANGGVSRARNAGIDSARGEYIAFIDSDDYVFPYWLSDLYEAIVAQGADISRAGHYSVGESQFADAAPKSANDLRGCIPTPFKAGVLSGEEYFHTLAEWCACTIWGQLCKAELQKQCLFPQGRLAEDISVCVEQSQLAKRVVFISRIAYCWVQRPGGLSHATAEMGAGNVEVCDRIIELLEREGDTERICHCLMRKTEMLFYGLLSVSQVANFGITPQAEESWAILLEQSKRYSFLDRLPKRVRIQFTLMKVSPRLYSCAVKRIYARRVG